MSDEGARMNVTEVDGVIVVELQDRRILDEMSIMQLGEQLSALVAKVDTPKLVMDFVNVGHMSSSALGVLITVHKRVREKGGHLCLCNIRREIMEIFEITRLSEIFDVRCSKDDALGELGR